MIEVRTAQDPARRYQVSGMWKGKEKKKRGLPGRGRRRKLAEGVARVCAQGRPDTGKRVARLPVETKTARISASLCIRGAGTRSRTRDLLITSPWFWNFWRFR